MEAQGVTDYPLSSSAKRRWRPSGNKRDGQVSDQVSGDVQCTVSTMWKLAAVNDAWVTYLEPIATKEEFMALELACPPRWSDGSRHKRRQEPPRDRAIDQMEAKSKLSEASGSQHSS